jgi:hypothetical protein
MKTALFAALLFMHSWLVFVLVYHAKACDKAAWYVVIE